jgi:hypothetical protein
MPLSMLGQAAACVMSQYDLDCHACPCRTSRVAATVLALGRSGLLHQAARAQAVTVAAVGNDSAHANPALKQWASQVQCLLPVALDDSFHDRGH